MRSTLEVVRYYAEHAPHRTAVRGSGAVVTYRELLRAASVIARTLVAQRMRVVALALDNGPEWVAADLAAQLAGIPLVPVPSFFSAEQIRHVLTDAGADGLIADTPFLRRYGADLAVRTAAALGAEAQLAKVWARDSDARVPSDIAKVSYTSGTTGRPKGVALTQYSMDCVAQAIWYSTAGAGLKRHLCLLPLAMLLENVAGVYAPLRNGAEIVAPRLQEIGLAGSTGIDVRRLIGCLERYRPHSIILLPQTLLALCTAVENGALPHAELRFAAVGGARVSPALLERAASVGLPVYEGYGLTECASVVALNTPGAQRTGSVGRPLAHARVRIDDDAQIRVSGPAASGYVDAPVREHREIATGDLGHLDEDGFLYIHGRRKNVFITSFGRNVSPDWVEAELVRERWIAQAAVFGEARPWNVAVVVPAPGAGAADVQAVMDAINRALPDYARVTEWLVADEPFTPANGLLTANGRNRRAAIWARYRTRIDACYERALSETA
jgi:long-subunit acyl-CoA synthetase (AMP-forming)